MKIYIYDIVFNNMICNEYMHQKSTKIINTI